MADVVYHGLRQIWLEKLRASERGSLVHWVYWLLLHIEAPIFLIDDDFENEALTIRAEVNSFNLRGGDATSVCRFRLTHVSSISKLTRDNLLCSNQPTALKSHCPRLWAHVAKALASHVVFEKIISTLIDTQLIAMGPKNQLKDIVADFEGDNIDKWEYKGEAADRARFRIIIELLCYARNSTSPDVTPNVKADLQSLGGTWVRDFLCSQTADHLFRIY